MAMSARSRILGAVLLWWAGSAGCLCAQIAVPDDAVAAAKLMQRAEVARQRGDEEVARQCARAVLEFSPEDFAARTFLGQRWYEGRWRLAVEVEYLQRAAARAANADSGVAADAGAPGAVAAVADARERDGASMRAERAAVARREAERRAAAAALRELWRARWLELERGRLGGLATVRLQHVRLLGFDTVPVGFGTGSGTLQLPRTESISFGGTFPF